MTPSDTLLKTLQRTPHTLRRGPPREDEKDDLIDSTGLLGHLKDCLIGHSKDTWNAFLGNPDEVEQLQIKRLLKMFAAKHCGASRLCEHNVVD